MEDYLEAIDALTRGNGAVRVKDISDWLGVRKSSVNAALGTLVRKGLVIHERYGRVELTSLGASVARDVQKRHDTLMVFLTDILKVDAQTACEDACRMEHTISPQTFARLRSFVSGRRKTKEVR